MPLSARVCVYISRAFRWASVVFLTAATLFLELADVLTEHRPHKPTTEAQ